MAFFYKKKIDTSKESAILKTRLRPFLAVRYRLRRTPTSPPTGGLLRHWWCRIRLLRKPRSFDCGAFAFSEFSLSAKDGQLSAKLADKKGDRSRAGRGLLISADGPFQNFCQMDQDKILVLRLNSRLSKATSEI